MPHHNLPRTIQCELSSSLTAYQDLVQQILDVLTELEWQKKDLFGVHLALEESISNAIRHGNKEDPAKRVNVECQLSPDRFWAKVCDEGDGYDPEEVPDCRCNENIEATGGRGLALIRAYMTSVELSQCGNCLTMEKVIAD